jgi:imidazoleglycerol phosphate dehydratase HisB
MQERFSARIERTTKETQLELALVLNGRGDAQIASGVPFLDHLLTALCVHAGLDLTLECRGDLQVDDHHTVEDCALALGQALARALGDGRGRLRFGSAYAPLDEALARAVIDLSGRPWPAIDLGLRPGPICTWMSCADAMTTTAPKPPSRRWRSPCAPP